MPFQKQEIVLNDHEKISGNKNRVRNRQKDVVISKGTYTPIINMHNFLNKLKETMNILGKKLEMELTDFSIEKEKNTHTRVCVCVNVHIYSYMCIYVCT